MNWEYCTVSRIIGAEYAQTEVEMLNEMGRNGWELVGTRDDAHHLNRTYYFKRRRA
jgi:hypothetical protein